MRSKMRNFLLLGLILGAVLIVPGYRDISAMVSQIANMPVIVIDPGHGGIDGGAQSRDGKSEKDINLSISKQLKKQLEEEGITVVLTRNKDQGLYDESRNGAIRSLKTQDMRARKSIIDKSDADLVLSIHLNSFTQDNSVKGAQVFYPQFGNEKMVKKSKKAAEIIQKNLNKEINTEKPRTALGKSDVLLLREAKIPTVIVECGFLSNAEDAENLWKESYQKRIVKVLNKSICSHLSSKSLKHKENE